MPRDAEQLIQTLSCAVTRRLLRIAGAVLPWSDRSQHDAWRAGYAEGARDATKTPTDTI